MSITVQRVIKHIRLQINDFDEAKVSNYQILNYLNRALSAISTALAADKLDFLAAAQTYNTASATDGVDLPDDFQSVNEVTDGDGYTLTPAYVTKTPKAFEYKVMGEKLYCGAASYTLFYQRFIPPVDDMGDTIAVPAYCLGLIVQTTIQLMQGMAPTDVATLINSLIGTEIPGRTYDKKAGMAAKG